jgi:hypothetical protein
MARVRLRSAPFAAVYGPMAGRARSVWTEQMLMIFPGSAWQHPSGDGAAHDEGAGEVGVDHAPPVREAHVEERFAVLDAGVVDEDVDGTHVGFDRLDGGGHGGFLDDVEGAGRDPVVAEVLGELGARVIQAGRVDAVEDDRGSGVGESFGDGEPDPPAGTGDQCDAAGEVDG